MAIGGATQYQVIEGQAPRTTMTTFTFAPQGHLTNVIWRRSLAAQDAFYPLFEHYRALYGEPTEFRRLAPVWERNAAIGEARFANDRGSVILLVVVPFGPHNPYVMLIETFRY